MTTLDSARELVWAAHPELLAIGASGPAPLRAVIRTGSVVGVDLGVEHYWGIQITAGLRPPEPNDAASAMQWCRERDRGQGWCVSLPEALADSSPWSEMEQADPLTMWAIDVDTAARLPLTPRDDLELLSDPTLADVRAAYGGWMADMTLAKQLVRHEDRERRDRRFIVARLNGEPVGCAFIWWAGGTGYLSGIGVVERLRGQGIGHTLSTAAAHVAARGVEGKAPQIVWMHATEEGAALYERMGFVKIDTEAQLTPR
ncbi:MAG: GNAT family N-acetyltransferase [Actinomycetes bacterium]